MTRRTTVLVARLDNAGDVLLAGPAVRAVAAGARRVVLLTGPNGGQAARLLPGVDEVLEWHAPWIDPDPRRLTRAHSEELISLVEAAAPGQALILTSFHQSSLPLALLLRLAGVPWIAAISEDYPGSLLDVRHIVDETEDVPEAERMLGLARAAGFALPRRDDGALAVRRPLPDVERFTGPPGYVVVHPGASAPARAWPAELHARAVRDLVLAGVRVVVTGGPDEQALTARVAGAYGHDLGGVTTFAELAAVLDGAAAVVVGNTGPAHLAAAVGTPVVSLFAPVVPATRWAPYRVPVTLLGDQEAACRGSRARVCPVPGHPCLSSVPSEEVVRTVLGLVEPLPDAPLDDVAGVREGAR
ncbi:glycosyl transferase [Sphaerisporangium siamense]|uniref:ADP-heptose:LPS heptosyltransferase n=1 Tax=Sphaerisporangium siamense TaxID=795645 RepID=A0A7W7G637_9ACTN|nr:glycosyltransferase family 9 protein [Sphaerisporangium siamense]MBB4699143.1 ADP-heptose:LPS heptosyltransferase [Sphaerisporangium siamense]GII86730.1 glycosyl transferase [Sphaerisporangium siamense]